MSKKINFSIANGKYVLSVTEEELDKARANSKLSTKNLDKLYREKELVDFLNLASDAELLVLADYIVLDDLIGIRVNIMQLIMNTIASRQVNVSSKKKINKI